jgi:transposase-like protein
MISRTNYSLDFKKKLAREMSLGENSAARISKRESISVQTLYRWRDRYGFNGEVKVDSEKEIKELKNLLAKYETALGELYLENHLLKKMDEFLKTQEKKKSSFEPISASILKSKKAAR